MLGGAFIKARKELFVGGTEGIGPGDMYVALDGQKAGNKNRITDFLNVGGAKGVWFQVRFRHSSIRF